MTSFIILCLLNGGVVASASVKERRRELVTPPRTSVQYIPRDLLDCTGDKFWNIWSAFLPKASKNARAGFPKDEHLFAYATQIYQKANRTKTSTLWAVLEGAAPVTTLRGFCHFGMATASFIAFRHSLDPQFLLKIEENLKWSSGPLDFSESSSWPTLWRHASLHLEEYRRRGNTSWSAELAHWGDDEQLLPRPVLSDVVTLLNDWLHLVGAISFPWAQIQEPDISGTAAAYALSRRLSNKKRVSILVWGHHVGSSMEPFTMLREAVRIGSSVRVEATFCGQRHPTSTMICEEFGFCEKFDVIDKWSKRYEHQVEGVYWWMPDFWDQSLRELADCVRLSGFPARVDAIVCGGPAWLCVMLRSVWAVPMMLYFAWPIAPFVPGLSKTRIFAQLRALGEARHPPTVFVVANWVLAAQFALQIRLRVPVRRPHGLYANQTYVPVPAINGKQRVMFTREAQWSGKSGEALIRLAWNFLEQAKREGRPYPFDFFFMSITLEVGQTIIKYSDFAHFHACIFWPWDIMMLMFNELYTMTVPMLLPERRWMLHLIVHALRYTPFNWYHLWRQLDGRLPDVANVDFPLPLPWFTEEGGLRQAAYWYELSDFIQFPHLTYFTSLPDMLDRTATLDVTSIRAGMRIFNALTVQSSLTFYRRAVAELFVENFN